MPVPPDLNTIHNPATGTVAPAAWGDGVRDWTEFLVDPPACSVFNSGTQNVGNGGTFNSLTADSENFDNDGMHSLVSNTARITANTAGRYLFVATVSFAAGSTTGDRAVRFLLNGTGSFAGLRISGNQVSGNATVISAARMITMAAGDFVECEAAQTSGANPLAVSLQEFAATFQTR